MFAFFTLAQGLSPKYVLDEMSRAEMSALLKYGHHRERAQWERTRFAALCALLPYSKKALTERDVITFPWEQDNKAQAASVPTEAQVQDVINYWDNVRRKNQH